jgi:hypothetical protein
MSDYDYQRCKFSITCQTSDLAIVHCLRALCQFSEKDGIKQIGWGGASREAWRAAGNKITLRFTHSDYRDTFITEAKRILPANSWEEVDRSDSDPATRQRAPH